MLPIMAAYIVDSNVGDIAERSANKESLHSARAVFNDIRVVYYHLLSVSGILL